MNTFKLVTICIRRMPQPGILTIHVAFRLKASAIIMKNRKGSQIIPTILLWKRGDRLTYLAFNPWSKHKTRMFLMKNDTTRSRSLIFMTCLQSCTMKMNTYWLLADLPQVVGSMSRKCKTHRCTWIIRIKSTLRVTIPMWTQNTNLLTVTRRLTWLNPL